MTTTETTQFTIGANVKGTDGICGTVTQVVVDPVGRAVTHLIVEPKHRRGLGRLVPLDLVDEATEEVRLGCTTAEFAGLDFAEQTQFVHEIGMSAGLGMGVGNITEPVVVDTIPLGEVAVRRGDRVRAVDGDIGKVQGLVIDAGNHGVTHVLLQEGHLWGRKDVAIPIRAVTGVDDGIAVNLTKQQIQDLPPADISHPTP